MSYKFLKEYGYKVYKDPKGFGNSAIRTKDDKDYKFAGKVELIESRHGYNYNGAYIKMDSIKNTVNACFYKNNFFVGPRIDIDNKDFEYDYSDGNNAYFGYRISYKNGEYKIGYYDKGAFTGKIIIINEKGNIYYCKASSFDSIISTTSAKVKFADLSYYYSTSKRKVPYDKEKHYGHETSILYYIKPNEYFKIYGKGIMRCHSSHDVLLCTREDQINAVAKAGFGKYNYDYNSFIMGYLDRYNITTPEIVGFKGPCISKFNEHNYALGFFENDRLNDLGIVTDFNSKEVSLGMFSNGKRSGFVFDTDNNLLQLALYLNDQIVSDTLVINPSFDIAIGNSSGVRQNAKYPYEIKKEEVTEQHDDVETLDFKKAIKTVSQQVEKDFYMFKYEVEYEKKVSSNNIVTAIPKVKILKYIANGEYISIPEYTYDIAEGAFSENVSKVKSIYFASKHISKVSENMFINCKNVEKISIPYGSGIKTICKNAFAGENVKDIRLNTSIRKVEKDAFTNCNGLKILYVDFRCDVEVGAVNDSTIVIYENAYSEADKKLQKEMNKESQERYDEIVRQRNKEEKEKLKEVKKLAKENKKYNKRNKGSNPKGKYVDESIIKDTSKSSFSDKMDSIKSFLTSGVFGFIGTILYFLLQVILFVPKMIAKGLSILFKQEELDGTSVISVLIVIVGAIFLILGFTDVLKPILDGFDTLANEKVPSLFGFRLTRKYSEFVNYVRVDLDKGFLGIILILLYAIVAPFNFLLNVGVLILVILVYLLYIIYGLAFVYGLGGVLFVVSLIITLKSENKGLSIICLVFTIAIAIIYYIMFGTFYHL